jgi:nicotinate-nucleotide adenylyltransferase
MGIKIGVFGGTFNPIHNAHLTLAEFARDRFALDKVIIIPANIPALKDTSDLVDKDYRVHMVKMAIHTNPNFELSTIEIDRKGKSYTVDSFEELKRLYPDDDLYLIIGADSFYQLEKWERFKKLIKLTNIIVAARNDCDISDLEKKANYFKLQYEANVYILDMPTIDISSTIIRNRIREGRSVKYLLPDEVCCYMADNKLYLDL